MAPPSAPLQVASARFFRLECAHEQLFCPEYKRSNRTKGLKILRCFPHCCPEHIDRSYCGSSLSVQVQLAERPPGSAPLKPSPSQVLSVFARFEAVSDVSLRAGECVQVDKIQHNVQANTNLEGQWIAGVLDRPSGLVIRTANGEDSTLVFHLHGKSVSRWCYDWESGANKAQRLMKHVLKAYVVEQCAVDMNNNLTAISSSEDFTQLYRVLHVTSSPEFTVISYRRGPLKQIQAAQDAELEESNLAAKAMKMAVNGSVPPYSKRRDDLDALDYEPVVGGQSDTVVPVLRQSSLKTWGDDRLDGTYEPKLDAKRRHRVAVKPTEEILAHPLEGKLLWEHSKPTAVAVSKNLALLYALLSWAPLGLYSSCVNGIVETMERSLQLLPTTALRADKRDCFSELLFQHCADRDCRSASGEEDNVGRAASVTIELQTLLRVSAQALGWLSSKQTRQWLRKFFRLHAGCVLDKTKLRAIFLLFLRELEERLNAEVFAATPLSNLGKVAEEVIAAVYSYPDFHAKRPQVRQLLSGQSFAGWNAFVAHMRDTFISNTKLPRRGVAVNFLTAYRPHNAIEKDWTGTWLLDMERAQWKPNTPSESDMTLTLLSLFEILSQVVRLEVALDIEGCSLRIRSSLGIAGRLDCMHVVLDSKDRVFRLFPNGTTAGGSGGANGDYVGDISVDEKNQLVIYLDVFKWATQTDDRSYHVRMRFECQRGAGLAIDGDILATTASTKFTEEEVAEMPLRAKSKSVDKTRVGGEAPLPAWEMHSNFQLNYEKMKVREDIDLFSIFTKCASTIFA